jgi:tRNA A-37 threonylcarbamoyl transferase component Bud32
MKADAFNTDSLNDFLQIALAEHTERKIGEGNFGYVLGKFDQNICFKVGKRSLDPLEYVVQKHLYDLKMPVAKPYEFLNNAIAMEVINGMNLEQIQKEGLKMVDDVKEALADAIEDVTKVIVHGDLALRNMMLGDMVIEDGVIVDAEAFAIDFGMSTIKPNITASREGENFIAQIKRIF